MSSSWRERSSQKPRPGSLSSERGSRPKVSASWATTSTHSAIADAMCQSLLSIYTSRLIPS